MVGSQPKRRLLERRPDFPDNAILPAAGRPFTLYLITLFVF